MPAILLAVLGLLLVPAAGTAAVTYDGGWRVPIPKGTDEGFDSMKWTHVDIPSLDDDDPLSVKAVHHRQ